MDTNWLGGDYDEMTEELNATLAFENCTDVEEALLFLNLSIIAVSESYDASYAGYAGGEARGEDLVYLQELLINLTAYYEDNCLVVVAAVVGAGATFPLWAAVLLGLLGALCVAVGVAAALARRRREVKFIDTMQPVTSFARGEWLERQRGWTSNTRVSDAAASESDLASEGLLSELFMDEVSFGADVIDDAGGVLEPFPAVSGVRPSVVIEVSNPLATLGGGLDGEGGAALAVPGRVVRVGTVTKPVVAMTGFALGAAAASDTSWRPKTKEELDAVMLAKPKQVIAPLGSGLLGRKGDAQGGVLMDGVQGTRRASMERHNRAEARAVRLWQRARAAIMAALRKERGGIASLVDSVLAARNEYEAQDLRGGGVMTPELTADIRRIVNDAKAAAKEKAAAEEAAAADEEAAVDEKVAA